MNDSLVASTCSLQYPMSSQSGNISDLAAYSGHPSSFLLETEANEPNSSPRHGFVQHPPPLPSDMGLRYMPIQALDDARGFSSDSGTSNSPVYSIESTIPTSTVNFSPFSNLFHQPQLSGSTTYSTTPTGYYSPNPLYSNNLDIKPRLGTINPQPGMAPPVRSSLPPPVSPVAREIYSTNTPSLRRPSDIHSRSPSIPNVRGVPLSPSSSAGFATPGNMESSQLSNNAQSSPPLSPTEELLQMQTSEGQAIRPEIYGKIDKGFFLADNDWTCYRRNYFSLVCSYTIHPTVSSINMIHVVEHGNSHQVFAFAMSISAVVDGRDGKAIELVQHTPKRDKGPQGKPDRKVLSPRPAPSGLGYGSGEGGLPAAPSLFDQRFGQHPQGPPIEASFERIQFKQATANNGKRRAAQQYYHLMVELWADTGAVRGENRWVKVARRMSAPMVVRGRSPGHYHGERRGSMSSTGGGSGGHGADGGGSSYPAGGASRGAGDSMSMGGGSSMLPGAGYSSGYDGRSHHYGNSAGPGNSHLETPVEPIMSTEDVKAIEEFPGYQYFPSTLYEGGHVSSARPPALPSFSSSSYRDDRGSGFHLPEVSSSSYTHGNGMPRIKQEYNSGLSLPSLTSGLGAPELGRFISRFEGVPTSKNYYPVTTMFPQSEVDTT